MARNRRTEHLRYRYGICLNDNCPKSKNKDVQQIPARKDFVCEECGKPLRECPPPKKGPGKMLLVLLAAIAIIVIGLGLTFGLSGGAEPVPSTTATDSIKVEADSVSQSPVPDTIVVEKTDTVVKTDTIVVKEEKSVSKPVRQKETTSKIKVPFGKYEGPSSGLGGTINVTKAYSLDLRKGDGTSLELLPGDQIQQTKFQDGDLKQGVWVHQGSRQFFTR